MTPPPDAASQAAPNADDAGANDPVARVLDQLGWLRGLARELCRDPHAADDAVQDTVTAALHHRPDTRQPMRGWLATVLANSLRGSRRAQARRAAREQRVAAGGSGSAPPAAELAERIERQRMLLDAVQALPEPLQTTVVLRFLEGMPPRRIAAAQGVPVATVKARLQRGLAALRARLDRQNGGDRRAWVSALMSLEPVIGAAVMSKKVLLGGAALVAALTLVAVPLFTEDAPAVPDPGGNVAATAAPKLLRSPEVSPSSDGDERTEAAPANEPTASPAEAAATRVVRGVVLDPRGNAVPAMAVRSGDARAVTDGAGRFALNSGRGGWIAVDQDGWTTIFAGADRVGVRDSIVVAARAIAVAGRVTGDGLPVAGAHVEFDLPDGFRAALPLVLDDSRPSAYSVHTDELGAFDLPEIPAVDGAALRFTHPEFTRVERPLPLGGDPSMLVTMERPTAAAERLGGTVLDADGRPAAGALVLLGRDATTTRRDGSFAFDFAATDDPARDGNRARARRAASEMIAVRQGSLPGRLDATGRSGDGEPQWPVPLVLRLGGPALSIAGRVLDAEDRPAADVRVWVNGLEHVGVRPDPERAGSMDECYLENELRGAPPGWQPVRTDADGRFRIDGLCPRDYHLTAIDEDTALRVDRDVAAGTENVVLRFDAEGLLPEVHGVVTDRAGRPLEHVEVGVTTDAYRQVQGGYATGIWHMNGNRTYTDADGRFVLRGLPRARAYLHFSGDEVIPTAIGRGDLEWRLPPAEDIRVEMLRRCHFQLELLEPGPADQVAMLDAAGEELTLTEFTGNGSWSSDRMPVVDGRTSVLATTDAAQTLVLYGRGEELRRMPVLLVPGEVTRLRF